MRCLASLREIALEIARRVGAPGDEDKVRAGVEDAGEDAEDALRAGVARVSASFYFRSPGRVKVLAARWS